MSAAEPGGKPMINRIGCEGKSPACPCATAATAPSARVKPKIAIRCMAVLPVLDALMPSEPLSPHLRTPTGSAKRSYRVSDNDVAPILKPERLARFSVVQSIAILTYVYTLGSCGRGRMVERNPSRYRR